jgi:hypothetical protein
MVMPEQIQPGWQVVDSFGEEIGTVASVSGQTISVKLYGGGEVDVSTDTFTLVETGRVELSKSKRELDA